MRFKTMTVSGFESAANEVTVDFEDKPMLLFRGDNGSGKSMLAVWAPLFALFGKVRGRTITDAISSTSGAALVDLEFEISGDDYRIIRKLPRRGRQEATLYGRDDEGEWDALTEKEVKSTNAKIEELLAMSYTTAMNTFVAEQGKYGLFCEGTPAERRRILTQILGLEAYDLYLEATEEKLTEAKARQSGTEAQLEENATLRESLSTSLSESFADMDDMDLEDERDSLDDQIEDATRAQGGAESELRRLRAEVAAARQAIEDHQEARRAERASAERDFERAKKGADDTRVKALRERLERASKAHLQARELQNRIDNLEGTVADARKREAEFFERMESTQQEGEDAKERLTTAQNALDAIGDQKERLQETIDHDSQSCFTCTQPLSDELARTIMAQLDKEQAKASKKVSQYEATLSVKRDEYRRVRSLREEARALIDDHSTKLSQALSQRSSLDTLAESADELKTELNQAEDALAQGRKDLDEANKALNALQDNAVPPALTERLGSAQADLEAAEAMAAPEQSGFIQSLRSRLSAITTELTSRASAREREAILDSRFEQIKTTLASQEEEVGEYEILRRAFSPTGIPSMVMAGVVEELENEANEYLERFSNGKMSLNVETQRETKTGKVNEEIFISVNMPDGVRDYTTLSGGQQFRVNLAVRIAFSKVSASRRGSARIETVIIDEGFGSLDIEGLQASVAALQELSSEVNVIAVSHVGEVVSGFTDTTTVSIVSGGTEIEEES